MSNLRENFSKIYDKYVDKIYRFVFVKVNSQEIAQDLTSETFLRGWKSFQDQNKKIENHSAFLYQIARNLVVDYYRQKGKNSVISTENLPITDPRTNLEEGAIFASDLDVIKANLAGLKDEYQTVVIWHYLDDLSVPEIAKMLNKSEEGVRVTLHRALKALRDKVEEV